MSNSNTDIQTQALEATAGFFDKLGEASVILTEKLIDVAPEAADALLNLIQFKGIFELVVGFIALILTVTLVFKVIPSLIKGYNKAQYDEEGLWGFGLFFSGCATMLAVFISCACLFCFTTWLSAFYPEGALALRALEAVGINL